MNANKVSCQDCDLAELCIPLGLDKDDVGRLDEVIRRNKKAAKKARIYSDGDRFSSFYAVRSGSVKTVIITEEGDEQITGFYLPGEIFGMDGLATKYHQCDAIALQDSSFCQLPVASLDHLSGSLVSLRQRMMALMGQQITDSQKMMVLLGNKNAEERLAAFLLGLNLRHRRYGVAEVEINLSMSREEMANFLGLTSETVSRLMASFRQQGLIDYKGRTLFFKDIATLKRRVSLCNGQS